MKPKKPILRPALLGNFFMEGTLGDVMGDFIDGIMTIDVPKEFNSHKRWHPMNNLWETTNYLKYHLQNNVD